MKAATVIGVILVLLGIIGLFAGGTIFTHQRIERGIGPLRVQHQQMVSVPIPPLVSILVLIGGIALVTMGTRQR